MALQDTLDELETRRLAYKAFERQVDAELRELRAEKLNAEKAGIRHLVVKAAAEGATTGQIKRAYGTKDHRTVADVLIAGKAEIEAIRQAEAKKLETAEWFSFEGDRILVQVDAWVAYYTWTEVEGEIMFSTDEPLWDSTFTTKNEAVALLDGKLESESVEAGAVARAIRKRQG